MKYAFEVDEVPCSQGHDGEVFASFRVNHTGYPGDDEVLELAETKCADLQFGYVLDSWADFGDADIYYFTPDRTTWRRGDRHITCIFGASDPKHPLEGSLRSDTTTLDA
ncbi:septum formation family protein, partial [Streptomyces atriruber]